MTGGGLSVAVPAFILTWFVFDGVWPETLPDRSRFAITYLALFGSVLGFFWSLLNPLLLLAVYAVVFTYIFSPGVQRCFHQ